MVSVYYNNGRENTVSCVAPEYLETFLTVLFKLGYTLYEVK